MRKKVLLSSFILGASLLGIFSLTAAGNRVEIVDDHYTPAELSPNGATFRNEINRSNTDLVNGEVAIELTMDNSKSVEVFYVIDNSQTANSIKGNVIDVFKAGAKGLEEFDNLEQGIVATTNDDVTIVDLDNKNIESQLETIKTLASSTSSESEIFTSIDEAASRYTDADLKVMVIFLKSMPTLNTTQVTELKNKINEYSEKDIKFLVYGVDLSNRNNFTTIFEKATRYDIASSAINNIDFAANIVKDLPSQMPGMAAVVSFDKYILDNFTIKDIKTDLGVAHYDETNNQVIWEAGDLNTNKVAKLTYYLSLNSVVDESLVEKINMKTNRQIKVTKMGQVVGTYPADEKVDDQVCSPTIRLLRESVDNPKTGITNYVVFGACMLMVASITILVLSRKSQFNRI